MSIKIKKEWIRDIRMRHKLTQHKFADSLYEIKRDRIADWESGRRNCPPIIFWAAVLTWDKVDIWDIGLEAYLKEFYYESV